MDKTETVEMVADDPPRELTHDEKVALVIDGTHCIVDGVFTQHRYRDKKRALRYVEGWDHDREMAAARRPTAGSGFEFGVLKAVLCHSPMHAERASLDDGREHKDVVGSYTGNVPPSSRCMRCAYHDDAARLAAEERIRNSEAEQAAERARHRLAIIHRLGLSEAEAAVLFAGAEK